MAPCFLPSVARAAGPADTLSSIRVCVLSGYRDIKGSCLACSPVCQQKVSRVGVAMVGHEVIACFHLDTKMSPMARFSQNITKSVVSCHNITPMLTSDGMMSKRVKGITRTNCTRVVSMPKPPLYGSLMDWWIPTTVM